MFKFKLLCNKVGKGRVEGDRWDYYNVEFDTMSDYHRFVDKIERFRMVAVNGILVKSDDIRRIIPIKED